MNSYENIASKKTNKISTIRQKKKKINKKINSDVNLYKTKHIRKCIDENDNKDDIKVKYESSISLSVTTSSSSSSSSSLSNYHKSSRVTKKLI